MNAVNQRRLDITRLVLIGYTLRVVGAEHNITPARVAQIFYRTLRDAVRYSKDDRAIACKGMKEYRQQYVMWSEILDKLAKGYYTYG